MKKIIITLLLMSSSYLYAYEKDWNFMVYMINNNNLHSYGIQNFRQMTRVGSTNSINILLQMDEYGKRESKRFYIKKNDVDLLEHNDFIATGTPQNLYDFVLWGITNFPSKYVLVDLWNHGSGIKDPHIWGRKIIEHRDELYDFNPLTGRFELNRHLPYDGKWYSPTKERGIAFNDAAEEYLTNQDLKDCLEKICQDGLNGNTIDILAMDACHMAMVEIASQVKNAAKFMVASEEVEPGGGYNYYTLLDPFTYATLAPGEFAFHIVSAYESEYFGTMGDYTQSAVDLAYTSELEQNISDVATLLIDLINESGRKAHKALRSIRLSNRLTTEFLDVDYIDLGHFMKSLIDKADGARSTDDKWPNWPTWLATSPQSDGQDIWDAIANAARTCLNTLKRMVIANTYGSNFSQTCGLSIYFPVRNIDSSYEKTVFAESTTWLDFLKKYLGKKSPETEVGDALATA